MTDTQRDPETDDEPVVDEAAGDAAGARADEDRDGPGELDRAGTSEAGDVAPAVAAGTAATAVRTDAGAPARRRDAAARSGVNAAGPSDVAVHVDDRISAIFVLVTIGVFVAILLNGALFGVGGLITGVPTPAPSVSASPTASPSPSPSGSPSPSPSASPSPSPAPSSSPSPSGSPASTPSPSAS